MGSIVIAGDMDVVDIMVPVIAGSIVVDAVEIDVVATE